MCLSNGWVPVTHPSMHTIYSNKTHQAEDSEFQRSSLCHVGKGEVLLNDLTWIHRKGRSGRWGRCTCWVWSRNHLHINSGRLLQRGTWHSFKQHKNVHCKVQDKITLPCSLGARTSVDCTWEKIQVMYLLRVNLSVAGFEFQVRISYGAT